MIIINFFGGPSSGKSTVAAGLFYLMKINGYSVELVGEVAKDLVHEKRFDIFGEQNYLFSEQRRRQERLKDVYDFAITDSPTLLASFYNIYDGGKENQFFDKMVMEDFKKEKAFNIFLNRGDFFEVKGRRHSEEESSKISINLKNFLNDNQIKFIEINSNPKAHEEIFEVFKKKYKPTLTIN